MDQLRRFLLLLLFLAGCSAPAGAQNAGNSAVTGNTSTAAGPQVTGKAGAATGIGSGPQITCFGGSTVLTCLDNAGGPPFQVTCFGGVHYQSCFSFNSSQQFSLSGLGASVSTPSLGASLSTPSLGASLSTPSLGASPSDPITGAGSQSPTGTNRH
jgi:hypothetical protein